MIRAMKVGIVGCGNISGIYFTNGPKLPMVDVIACADINIEKAKARAAEYNIPIACSTEELIANPEVEIIINLTVPQAHFAVTTAALMAGKHVYTEKPLALTREDGIKILALAEEKGLRVGCAPDTFLGAGLQTCRKVIDDGWIGRPIGANAFMPAPHRGPENWHPDPEFFYQVGGGPMYDMGPYYLTAMVHLMGPIARVAGANRISFPTRTITSQPKYGNKIQVEIPTHVNGLLEFDNGAVATIMQSFDIWAANLPFIEIYGTDGTLSLPDPNFFGGDVKVYRPGSDWKTIPHSHIYGDHWRMLGVADMSAGIQLGRPHRASGALALHVLDVMQSIHEASDQGKSIAITNTVAQPEPMKMGLITGQID